MLRWGKNAEAAPPRVEPRVFPSSGVGGRAPSRAATAPFEGAARGRRLAGLQAPTVHVNQLIAAAGPTLTARARWMYKNLPYAKKGVNAWVNAHVATGIVPSWRLPNQAKSQELIDLFDFSSSEIDADGRSDFYGFQRRVDTEECLAGEAFVRFRPRLMADGLAVPLQLQLIPSEQCPMELTRLAPNGNVIRQGIELDAIGRRVAYWFWRRHPQDNIPLATANELVRVPASEILHVFESFEAGQLRGFSRLTAAIVKLFLQAEHDDNEQARHGVASLYSVFITEPADEDGDDDEDVEGDVIRLSTGAVNRLRPGEKIEVAAPADVGANYEAYQYRQGLAIAAALDLPYVVMFGDLVRSNFSNNKGIMVDFGRQIESHQHSVLGHQFLFPFIRRWVDAAQASGAIVLPGYARNPRPYIRPQLIPPKFEWLDRLKDVQADVLEVQAGFASRRSKVAARGGDIEEVDRTNARDRANALDQGLRYSTDLPPAGTAQPDGAASAGTAALPPPDPAEDDAAPASDPSTEN